MKRAGVDTSVSGGDHAKPVPPIRSRGRKYAVLLIELAAFFAVFMGVSAYQSRNLLDTDKQAAPALVATTLQSSVYNLSANKGQPVLIYFFAPWCPYCAASADNIVRLRRLRDEEKLNILIVALDWDDQKQIEAYAKKHQLNVPVLLADSTVAHDWKVFGFPTYYVLDSEHRVVRRDFGYSTQFGLWWRTWLVE